MKIKYSKKLLLIFTFVAYNHATLSMDEESDTAIQIQKYICDTYINQTFNSIQQMKKTTQQDITNSFQVYLQTNNLMKTLSKHTNIKNEIIEQFTTKKEQEKAKLVSITSMLGYALGDFCHALEDSGCLLCIASATALTSFLDNRNNNTRINQHISILIEMKRIWRENLITYYQKIEIPSKPD